MTTQVDALHAAAAASVDLPEAFLRYYREEGKPLAGVQGPHKVRCLLLEKSGRVQVLMNTDMPFKGFPHDLAAAVQAAIHKGAPQAQKGAHGEGEDRAWNLLFFATHSHSGAHTPAPLREGRRHWLLQWFVAEVSRAVLGAFARRVPCRMSFGQQAVTSISGVSDSPDPQADGWDPTLTVIRVAGSTNVAETEAAAGDGPLIATVVHFACHPTVDYGWCSESPSYLASDFPGAMETTVQKVYGAEAPVLFLNGAAGDVHPAIRRPPPPAQPNDRLAVQQYERDYAALRRAEVGRLGRVLGGEVIRLLAELEASGQELGRRNDRWGYAEWGQQSTGQCLRPDALSCAHGHVSLPRRRPEPGGSAEQLAHAEARYEAALQRFGSKALSRLKQKWRPRLTVADARARTPLFDLMEASAHLDRWRNDMQRVRHGAQADETATVNFPLAAWSWDAIHLGFVGTPLEIHAATGRAVSERSPFQTTLLCGYMTAPDLADAANSYLTTTEKLRLGGYHADNYDPAAEEVFLEAAQNLLVSL